MPKFGFSLSFALMKHIILFYMKRKKGKRMALSKVSKSISGSKQQKPTQFWVVMDVRRL